MKSMGDDANTKLKCPLCTQVFEDENMLIYHTNEFHKKIQKDNSNAIQKKEKEEVKE